MGNNFLALVAEIKNERMCASHFNKCSKSSSKFTKDSEGKNIFIHGPAPFEGR